ncbi:hypothetical protein R20233_04822 [Ralstonia sp. LMG 32965]|nr:hypothetical protein R20233_04822 [Ralstonia sp. LMG 32965]
MPPSAGRAGVRSSIEAHPPCVRPTRLSRYFSSSCIAPRIRLSRYKFSSIAVRVWRAELPENPRQTRIFSRTASKTGFFAVRLKAAEGLVYRGTFGQLSTENRAVSSITVRIVVYHGTFHSSIAVCQFRLSRYRCSEKCIAQQALTMRYPQRNTRARFNAFLFNDLTPPKGGAPPSRTHPAGFAVLPSPQGLCPSAYGLTPNRARRWRECLQSPAAPGRALNRPATTV